MTETMTVAEYRKLNNKEAIHKEKKQFYNKKYDVNIAIDPDIEKSGVSIIKDGILTLHNYSFFNLLDELSKIKLDCQKQNKTFCIHIEASWLISFNYSSINKTNERVKTKVANYVGYNHAVGKLLCIFFEINNIDFIKRRPLKKRWGKSGKEKISHDEFVNLWKVKALGCEVKHSNQEQRDAAMLLL